jgi:hypothetical protein
MRTFMNDEFKDHKRQQLKSYGMIGGTEPIADINEAFEHVER